MVGLDVKWVGILYMLFGVWNAINDPMLGVFIDRFRYTRQRGKYVYLMRVTAPVTLVSSFLMLLAQPSWEDWLIFVVLFILLFIFDTTQTAYSISLANYTFVAAPTKEERIDQFLTIAAGHNIRPMLVFFDDCWNPAPHTGQQPEPIPGLHNSGWWQSPGVDVVNDPRSWDRLERYVTDILHSFGSDERVLLWDLYNEPGNSKIESFALVEAVFRWARAVGPAQPLTIGLWNFMARFRKLNQFQQELSDIITFHHYASAKSLQKLIDRLQGYGRPLICTEWMARAASSRVAGSLPVFQKNNVGCINWGLVAGKTNTIYPWKDSWPGIKRRLRTLLAPSRPPAAEPDIWFHDLFHPDGVPYDETEIAVFKSAISNRN